MFVDVTMEKLTFKHCMYDKEGRKIKSRRVIEQDLLEVKVALP
jgi:hypothetical protein